MKFKKMWSYVIVIFVTMNAQAQLNCLNLNDIYQAGTFLSRREVSALGPPGILARNLKKTMIEKSERIKSSIQSVWKSNSIGVINSDQLSQLIVNVTERVGVDHQIFAAIVQKESNYCMFRHNKTGGDSGCMQFTYPAVKEMKHQFGLAGSGLYSQDVPQILSLLAENYFGAEQTVKMANYKKWLSQSIDNIKLQLRSGDYIEYDILTGAIFLKFLYAKANGNYNIAVRNYNGSKQKLAYQKAIINNAHKVFELYSAEELNDCENDVRYEFNIQRTACLIDEEPVECFEDYVSMLPNRT